MFDIPDLPFARMVPLVPTLREVSPVSVSTDGQGWTVLLISMTVLKPHASMEPLVLTESDLSTAGVHSEKLVSIFLLQYKYYLKILY